MTEPQDKSTTSIANTSVYYEPYSKFSSLIRTWLISYGIGSIALIASSETVSAAVKASVCSKAILILFLLGLLSQVVGALLYKYSMGIIYHAENAPEQEKWKRYKIADFISESFMLEALIDFVSIITYIVATYLSVVSVYAT